ncbi:MAG: hypothetical protein KAS32_24605 [Candidatus Peribacteraceae bacterium]|nr:hypothetical protein [Candidatus Peribacteraceae bacterium]
MPDINTDITPKTADYYALYIKHGNYSKVARMFDVEPSTIMYHVRKVREANGDGVSLVEHARKDMVDNSLPKAVEFYDTTMTDALADKADDKAKDRGLAVATNTLKGLQVLIPKTQEDKTTRKLELNVKADVIAQELGELLGLDTSNAIDVDCEIIEPSGDSIAPDTDKDPSPTGSDSDDRVCSDS